MVVSEIEYQMRSLDASWSYEKWEKLPNDGNRYEVIDGVLYMSTASGYRHQRSVMRLDRNVGVRLEEQGVAVALTAPIGLIMPGADPVQPDFMLIRSERTSIIADDERVRGVPDLIAEVLSPSHPELDTEIKLAAYARAGVPEYWIVRPETQDVLVHTGPETASSEYVNVRHFDTGSILESPTLPIQVAVADLFEMP